MLKIWTPNAHITDKNKPEALQTPSSGGKTPESRYHQITQLVAHTFDGDSAHVSLIDNYQQWFDSGYRLNAPKDAK
jgi:hypothetical protein